MDQEIEAAGEEEDLADFGDLEEAGGEGVNGIALVFGEFDVDEGLHGDAEFAEIDIGMSAAEESGLGQLLQPLMAGGGGEADGGGELLIRQPCILREKTENFETYSVKRLVVRHIPEFYSIAPME